jgi:hypothetical protein
LGVQYGFNSTPYLGAILTIFCFLFVVKWGRFYICV